MCWYFMPNSLNVYSSFRFMKRYQNNMSRNITVRGKWTGEPWLIKPLYKKNAPSYVLIYLLRVKVGSILFFHCVKNLKFVYCQCAFSNFHIFYCCRKLIFCFSCLAVLLCHLLRLHLYHVGWLLCAVISALAVLPMCHFSFLVVHKLVLMTRYIFLWLWIYFFGSTA